MAEIRYGHREGPGKGREYTVAADQYFARRGGKFVFMDGTGVAKLCQTGYDYTTPATTNAVYGWAESPKDTDGKSSYKSSSGDKMFVIYGTDDVYELPATAANVAASWIGRGAKIYTAGATHAMVQYAGLNTTLASCCLNIVDVDTTNNTVFVKIKPEVKQQGI